MSYKKKYLKYKIKYLNLKGGTRLTKEERTFALNIGFKIDPEDEYGKELLDSLIETMDSKPSNENIELIELKKIAKKYGIPYDTKDTEITLNDKIFTSPEYKAKLEEDEYQHHINVNRDLALFYNVRYNPSTETDVELQEKIFKSSKFQKQLISEELRALKSKPDKALSAEYRDFELTIQRMIEKGIAKNRAHALILLEEIPRSYSQKAKSEKTFPTKIEQTNEKMIEKMISQGIALNRKDAIRLLSDHLPHIKTSSTTAKKSTSRGNFISNYQLVRSPGDGSCLYWSLSSAMNREQSRHAMIGIKERIRDEYIRVIDEYPSICNMNSDELFIYLLGIDADNPELERDKQVLLCLAMGLSDTSFMNLPRPPRNPLDYISTFDQMYGGEAEIKMFVELYGIPVLNIDSTRRTAIFYRTPELERLQRREVYVNPIYSRGEERQLQRTVMVQYNELSEEQRRGVIVVSRSGAHYNYLQPTSREPFMVPADYGLM